jgi:hypothetical protein
MKVTTGRVVGGKIEFAAELGEGTSVAILAKDDSGLQLTTEEENELVTAREDIRRGNFIDARRLLEELEGSGGR